VVVVGATITGLICRFISSRDTIRYGRVFISLPMVGSRYSLAFFDDGGHNDPWEAVGR
jgi:hypothetical protein